MVCYVHQNYLTSKGNKVNSLKNLKNLKSFWEDRKGWDRGERALQNSGSAQRLSGARHRKTSLEKAEKKSY